jgi:hypothetical protein
VIGAVAGGNQQICRQVLGLDRDAAIADRADECRPQVPADTDPDDD